MSGFCHDRSLFIMLSLLHDPVFQLARHMRCNLALCRQTATKVAASLYLLVFMSTSYCCMAAVRGAKSLSHV